jgi:osmoprotectant transport system ATP-binding protein
VDATADPLIRLSGVGKHYADGTVAVQDLDLEVPTGEVVVLIGPSGCGKSTTLKMVNRLIEPTSGRIFFEGTDVTTADPVALRRRMGYVIQQTGLFPHQRIGENVATVPKLLGWDKARVRARVEELLSLVGLEPSRFANRFPHQLSGGQRQRVGVARALAADPPVLLMDEPFGAVDPVVRERLQTEFRSLQQGLGKTVLFVTHDLDEAVRLGDRIAVLAEGGRLQQYGPPGEVLGAPATEMVREFVGSDRTLKRLSVAVLTSDDLDSGEMASTGAPGAGAPEPVELGASLRTALSRVLESDDGRITVIGDKGEPVGTVSLGGIHRALRDSERRPAD